MQHVMQHKRSVLCAIMQCAHGSTPYNTHVAHHAMHMQHAMHYTCNMSCSIPFSMPGTTPYNIRWYPHASLPNEYRIPWQCTVPHTYSSHAAHMQHILQHTAHATDHAAQTYRTCSIACIKHATWSVTMQHICNTCSAPYNKRSIPCSTPCNTTAAYHTAYLATQILPPYQN